MSKENSNLVEGSLFSPEEQGITMPDYSVALTKYGKPDHRCKPAVRDPRPELSMEDMRKYLSSIKELTTATGIRYIKLRLTAKMIIGTREASGKEFTINLADLYRAYQECLRFTSPEVKKYVFMGHSPAVVLLRMLQNRHNLESFSQIKTQ